MKALLLDCDDSYTLNIADYFRQLGVVVDIVHYSDLQLSTLDFQLIVLPPGPKAPHDIPQLFEIIDQYKSTIPILGICLGHQAIGEYFGHQINLSQNPIHGQSVEIFHQNDIVFERLDSPFLAMRYNSLTVAEKLDSELEIICRDENKEIMGLKHKTHPIYSFQFHPESIGTPCGLDLFKNWLNIIN